MSSGVKEYKIGDFTIARVQETLSTGGTPQFLLPAWNLDVVKKHASWLIPGNMDDNYQTLIRSMHTWVIKSKDLTILVDTCIGNAKERIVPNFHRLNLPYLERLKDAGVTPEMVDYVFVTHMDPDHVGWNTRLIDGKWVPTFPKAKYVFSKIEQNYYSSQISHNSRNKACAGVYEDSVLPVIEAGQAELVVPDGGKYLDGVALHPTPGHTIGHMSISITSKGEKALIGGDVMHHPLQVYQPDWGSGFCEFPGEAYKSRLWALNYAADHRALLCSGHFAETSAGYVTRENDTFRWRFA